ncbi:MAG: serine hydrolase [Actinomycetota bacterium]|nr:serine hydrolase [Actinomycetota bacterium]
MLASEGSKTAFPIASATKLMTYYVAAEKLRPNREVVVAPYDAAPGESLAGLEAGDSLTTRDVLYSLIVASGNDAAATLALAVAGSEPDFVARMNAAADNLELSETEYSDPIGLSSDNVSSASDLVDLAVELKEQSLFQKIVDTPRITLGSGAEPLRLENRNTLVLEEPFMNGVKTGTTVEAGYVLVGSGRKKGVDLVSAVLGAPDAASRDAATLSLFDYGFSLYRERTLVERGERVGSVPLADGTGSLPLRSSAKVMEVARDDQRVDFQLNVMAPLEAPIAEGEAVGNAAVRLDGRRVGEVEALAARAVAAPPAADEGGSLPGWAWLVFGVAGAAALLLASLAVASRGGEPR